MMSAHNPRPGSHSTEEAAGEDSPLLDLPVNPDEGSELIPEDDQPAPAPT
jgi:hypothetical protein